MEALWIVLALLGLLALGLPIFVALGGLALILLATEGIPLIGAAQVALDKLNSSTLIAIPFFVMAASIMQQGGIAKSLVDMTVAWVGNRTGGLGMAAVLATAIFAAISGSSVVTALAMGTILVPAMVQHGYPRHFAIGLMASAGTLGILIPPSLSFILYALIAEQSVPRLFLAGVVPGLLQAGLFMAYVYFYARRNVPKASTHTDWGERLRLTARALPAMLVPIIVFVGLYGGLATVVESAALSALVALLVSMFFYRQTGLRDIPGLLSDSIKTSAAILYIVFSAALFGHALTELGITRLIGGFADSLNLQAWQFLIFINLVMLLLGMFLDASAVIVISTPLVLSILTALGINPIHYGVVLTVNMELGMLTPPVGLNLFVLARVTRAPLVEVIRGTLPFVGLMFGLLVLITYVPLLSTWLPDLILGKR